MTNILYHSMSTEKDLSTLLGNFKEALNHYNISDLNKALLNLLNKTNVDRDAKVEATIEYLCEKYSITRNQLLHSRYNRDIIEPRKLAYTILYNLEVSSRYIASRVFFYKNHANVTRAIVEFKKMNPNLKQDKDFLEKFNQAKEHITKKITESMSVNKYEKEQEALMAETNKNKLVPIDTSIYKKTSEEKKLLKEIKKSLKNG